MRYVIMANGKGRRWGESGGISKHLIVIDKESLLERMIRIIREIDPSCELILSSSRSEYDRLNVTRYAPSSNEFEIDRFPVDLADVPVCFIYGDVYYTYDSLRCIVDARSSDFLFFGNENSIVAVKSFDASLFSRKLKRLKERIYCGDVDDGKGWQLYHWLLDMPMPGHAVSDHFIRIEDETRDFNTPDQLNAFLAQRSRHCDA